MSSNSSKVETIKYEGSVAHFRAWMDRYLAINGNIFSFVHDGTIQEYEIKYASNAQAPAREVWHVTPVIRVTDGVYEPNSTWATILAVEELPKQTTIDFIDGLYYYKDERMYVTSPLAEPRLMHGRLIEYAQGELIGDDFKKIVKTIKNEFEQANDENDSRIPKEPTTRNLNDWFDYYYSVKGKLRIPMEYIADKTGYSISTVYKEHTYYKNSHDLPKRTVRKSKKK